MCMRVYLIMIKALVCHIWQQGFFHPSLTLPEIISATRVKQRDPIREDSCRNSRILIEQLPLMPMNSSLLHALLLLAVIIVLDECWEFLKNQSRFNHTVHLPLAFTHSWHFLCNNVLVGSQFSTPHLDSSYLDHLVVWMEWLNTPGLCSYCY